MGINKNNILNILSTDYFILKPGYTNRKRAMPVIEIYDHLMTVINGKGMSLTKPYSEFIKVEDFTGLKIIEKPEWYFEDNTTKDGGSTECYWCDKPIKDDKKELLPEDRGYAHDKCAEEFYGSQIAED